MPLRPPGFPPTSQADWDRFCRGTPVVPDDNSVAIIKLQDGAVTNPKLRDSAPASVIGRLQGTPGTPADIVASANDTFLVRRAGALTFGLLADTDIPGTIARDSEVTAAIAAETTAVLVLTDARYQLLPLTGSATYDPPSLADGAGATTTVTVTGAALGQFARAAFSLDTQGITITAWVSSTNTVSVRFQNESGGLLDLASGTLSARVDP
jgi:hypothetical protein